MMEVIKALAEFGAGAVFVGLALWFLWDKVVPKALDAYFATQLQELKARQDQDLADFKATQDGIFTENKANIDHLFNELLEAKRTELKGLEAVNGVKREAILSALSVLDSYQAFLEYLYEDGPVGVLAGVTAPPKPKAKAISESASRLAITCERVDVCERFIDVFLVKGTGDERRVNRMTAYEMFKNEARVELGLKPVEFTRTQEWTSYLTTGYSFLKPH